ncbi:RebB family R body protein [Corallococcus exiguus]|uniref:RebB family R body protein n=1 Tax=Corallococcus exiguus TaxID=83462 RepID=UPI001560C3BA|nr:RebB family R body protein [Corallococcus exiguus]MBN8466725.1 RebB family R body protein [Corallococcus exiguus]NRD43920.1 RebB family R body protein [Corallococcus exiguus]
MADTVNPQITDAIATTQAATVGEAAPVAMGMLYQAEAQVFAIGMQNATVAQQNMNQVGQAVMGAILAKITALVGKT